MVIYVAIIAIVNLCIGAALGYLLPPFAQIEPRRADDTQSDHGDERDGLAFDKASNRGDIEPSMDGSVESITDAVPSSSASGQADDTPRDLRSIWSEYAEQLRDIRQRAQYCRTSQDKNLGRQVAGQLQNSIENWYIELQQMLDAPDDVTLAGMDTISLEMFSAQIETSLSNIKAIDWSLKFDEVFGQLDNEITLLDEQQRTALSSAGRAHAASV